MKYIKRFERFNEALAGHMGAVHSATRNRGVSSGEAPSDKPGEFSCLECVDALYKRFASSNFRLKDVKIEKAEPKKGFLSRIFSGSSTIEFSFSKISDGSEAFMTVKLKDGKFVLSNSSTSQHSMVSIPDAGQANKLISHLMKSEWKGELSKSFEDIEKSLTAESFK